MFEKQQFIKPVYNLKDLPTDIFPSLVVCGRSNVGKSSFINSLFNRKDLAKISSTPGKTRSLNFYIIDDKFFLVDLPGIGYAKLSKVETEKLGSLISGFLSQYQYIHHIFHLVDSRHKPTQQDIELDNIINYNQHPFSVILTKADKLKQSQFSEARKTIINHYTDKKLNESIFFYSAVDKTGRKEVLKKISSLFY